jgi:hypothetical protein
MHDGVCGEYSLRSSHFWCSAAAAAAAAGACGICCCSPFHWLASAVRTFALELFAEAPLARLATLAFHQHPTIMILQVIAQTQGLLMERT